MTVTVEKALELLHNLDDPLAVERPNGFDERTVAARFEELVGRLNRAFDCQAATDSGSRVQDASFYGEVLIPARSTRSGADIAVRVSNFGNLAVYAIERLGAYTDAERDELMSKEDRDRVDDALEESGYVVLPEDVLWRPYDGVNEWLGRFYGERQPSWFVRFFDYI